MPPLEADLKRALRLGRTIGPARLAGGYFGPTLNVRAIYAGDDGPNAAIAIAIEASASVDFRLAPSQTPARIERPTETYLTKLGWFIVRAVPDETTRVAYPKVLRLKLRHGRVRPDDDPA